MNKSNNKHRKNAKFSDAKKQERTKIISLYGDDAQECLDKMASLKRPAGLSDEEWGIEIEETIKKFTEETVVQFEAERIGVCSFLILRQLLLNKELDFEKYYGDISELVHSANNEEDIDSGVNKITRKMSNEMSLRMQY